MLPSYQDIIDAAAAGGSAPSWFTEDGVPRFCDFHPKHLGVYDVFAGLFVMECAGCGLYLLVGAGTPRNRIDVAGQLVEVRSVDFAGWCSNFGMGDPPRHTCPRGGETMGCDLLGVAQAWEMGNDDFEWKRIARLETVKPEVWADRLCDPRVPTFP